MFLANLHVCAVTLTEAFGDMGAPSSGAPWGHPCYSTGPRLVAGLWVLMQCEIMVSNVQHCAMQRANKEPKALSFSDFRPALVCWRGFFGAVFRHLSAWMPCFGTVQ